jgi:UDP:flavonoid glycosyltransferase YjiC (YdhE family)
MARLLFATFGSLGDLHPVFALAGELRRRGHSVTLATSTYYEPRIRALGLDFAPLRPDISVVDPALVRRIMDGPRGTRFLLRDLVIPAVRDMLADLERAAAGADLLIASEIIYAAPLLAERRRLPWVSYTLAPLSYFPVFDPCVPPLALAGEWTHRLPPAVVRTSNFLAGLTTSSWWRPIRELRRELGLPPGANPLFAGKHSSLLDLALFSPELQRAQPDWPASTRQTGFCFFDEPSAPLPEPVTRFLAAGEPPILFTLGSAAVFGAGDFYAVSARAAQLLGRRALLLLGSNPPPPGLPPTILAWDYLPFARVFSHAAALVHQGGIGTTAQALRAGRPMLVVPFAHDQFDNAARAARLGVGRVVSRRRYHPERVARELQALLGSAAVVESASAIDRRLQVEAGTTAAGDALELALS